MINEITMQIPILRPVYKKNVLTNKYIQVGMVTNFGLMDFDIPQDKRISTPSYYYPEFYMDVERTVDVCKEVPKEDSTKGIRTLTTIVTGNCKKEFIPKSIHQQIVTLTPSEYYVTGYVTISGVAVYYDQFIS